jgi:hypothetical protein
MKDKACELEGYIEIWKYRKITCAECNKRCTRVKNTKVRVRMHSEPGLLDTKVSFPHWKKNRMKNSMKKFHVTWSNMKFSLISRIVMSRRSDNVIRV